MPPKAGFFLGKWYPDSAGYYYSIDGEGLGDFIIAHCHNNHEYPLRLEYEVPEKQ